MTGRSRRAWLFARDFIDEVSCAWSLARTRACERDGGHRWEFSGWDQGLQSNGQTCSRCGCWQSVAPDSERRRLYNVSGGPTTL